MKHPQVALGEVADLIRGITYKPSDVCDETAPSAVACMRTKNVQELLDETDIIWIPASIIRNSSKYLKAGDILVSSANSWNLVGKGCWVPELRYPASAGGFISILRGNQAVVDLRYLYHWFTSPQTQAKLRSHSNKTTSISNLDHSRTLGTELPLPPLEEQRRIAVILDKADQLRSHSRLLIKEVLLVEQSIFESLFGQFVSGSSAYPVKALEEIVQDNRIGLVRASNECGPEMPHSYIKMDAIDKNGRLQIHKAIKTSASPEELADYSVRDGDVLFNTRNSRELVGKTAVYRGAEEMLFNNNLMRLRFNSNTISPDFFRLFLSSRRGASELERRKSGTTSVCAVYWKNLKTMPVPVPPCDLQIQLAKSLERLERLTGKYRLQETYCDDLVKTLRLDLIGGSH